MPQFVRRQTGEANLRGCAVEHVAAEVVIPERPACSGHEDEGLGSFACAKAGQLVYQEPRYGDAAPLMRLRRRPDQLAVHLACRLCDFDPPTHQVDPADPQCSQLAPPKPAIRQDADGRAVVARSLGEPCNLRVREEALLGGDGAGEADALRGVPGKATISHGEFEDEREDPVSLAD